MGDFDKNNVGGRAFRRIMFDLEYDVALRLKSVVQSSGKSQRVWLRDLVIQAIQQSEVSNRGKKK